MSKSKAEIASLVKAKVEELQKQIQEKSALINNIDASLKQLRLEKQNAINTIHTLDGAGKAYLTLQDPLSEGPATPVAASVEEAVPVVEGEIVN